MNNEELAKLKITVHARDNMEEREVTIAELAAVLKSPDLIEPHKGRRRFVKGDLVAVIADDRTGPVLVTVLWRRPDRWTSGSMARR
jgi:hypothetical protein